jgi:hypothetical protein
MIFRALMSTYGRRGSMLWKRRWCVFHSEQVVGLAVFSNI